MIPIEKIKFYADQLKPCDPEEFDSDQYKEFLMIEMAREIIKLRAVVEAAKDVNNCTCGFSECDRCIIANQNLDEALEDLEKQCRLNASLNLEN